MRNREDIIDGCNRAATVAVTVNGLVQEAIDDEMQLLGPMHGRYTALPTEDQQHMMMYSFELEWARWHR